MTDIMPAKIPDTPPDPFEDLSDAEKVTFAADETDATIAHLDRLLKNLSALRTEVEDTDGLVRLTLGDDGRLLTLFIDEAVPASMTSSSLVDKLNGLIAAGNEGMRLSRSEFWAHTGDDQH